MLFGFLAQYMGSENIFRIWLCTVDIDIRCGAFMAEEGLFYDDIAFVPAIDCPIRDYAAFADVLLPLFMALLSDAAAYIYSNFHKQNCACAPKPAGC